MSIMSEWIEKQKDVIRRPSLDWGSGWEPKTVPNMRCCPCKGMAKEAVLCGHPGVKGCFSMLYMGHYDQYVFTHDPKTVQGGKVVKELPEYYGKTKATCYMVEDLVRGGKARIDVAFYTDETPEEVRDMFQAGCGPDACYEQFCPDLGGWSLYVYEHLVKLMTQCGYTPPPLHREK